MRIQWSVKCSIFKIHETQCADDVIKHAKTTWSRWRCSTCSHSVHLFVWSFPHSNINHLIYTRVDRLLISAQFTCFRWSEYSKFIKPSSPLGILCFVQYPTGYFSHLDTHLTLGHTSHTWIHMSHLDTHLTLGYTSIDNPIFTCPTNEERCLFLVKRNQKKKKYLP